MLDGRGDRGLIRRGITRVGEVLDAGVNLVTAQDDVNDPYYPFGKPDQLEVVQYMAHVAQLTYPPQLERSTPRERCGSIATASSPATARIWC